MTKKAKKSRKDKKTEEISQGSATSLDKISKVLTEYVIVGRYYLVTSGKKLYRTGEVLSRWLSKISDKKVYVHWLSEKVRFFLKKGKNKLKEYKLKTGGQENIMKKISLPPELFAKSQDKSALLEQLNRAVSEALPSEENDTLTILNLDEYLEQMKDEESK